MIPVYNIEQGTDEWMALRVGNPSASKFSDIITTKGEPSKSAKKYMQTLAAERITGQRESSFQSASMTRGIEMEEEACALFEMLHDVTVEHVGLCYLNEDKNIIASPDGLIGLDGGIEIKCPLAHTHIDYMLKGKVPTEYFAQVQGSLYVTGREFWWFMSYFPGLPSFIVKVERDEDFISKLAIQLDSFVHGIDDVVKEIKEYEE